MTVEAKAVYSDEDKELNNFTFENDDMPPGMDNGTANAPIVHVATMLGVAATAPPTTSSYPAHSYMRPGSPGDEQEIFIQDEEEASGTFYCPEDAASDFFTTVPPLVPVPISSSFDAEIHTNTINNNEQTVVGVPVNHSAESAPICSKTSIRFLKVILVLCGVVLIGMVALFMNVGGVADDVGVNKQVTIVEGSSSAIESDIDPQVKAEAIEPRPTPSPTVAPTTLNATFAQQGQPTTAVPNTPFPSLSPSTAATTHFPSSQPSHITNPPTVRPQEPSSKPSPQQTASPTTLLSSTPTKFASLTTRLPSTTPSHSPSTTQPTSGPHLPSTRPSESTTKPSSTPTNAPPSTTPSTLAPTVGPTTSAPTSAPSTNPTTQSPTESPSDSTLHPSTTNPTTQTPTESPSASATTTLSPSHSPMHDPTASPTTQQPTTHPTSSGPTPKPTTRPTTQTPTRQPTTSPSSSEPTPTPTIEPTTQSPTQPPAVPPSSLEPTHHPTTTPTAFPSTRAPTASPTSSRPTPNPTANPTRRPTTRPTRNPLSASPTSARPTRRPTQPPTTRRPTRRPSAPPTSKPTVRPSTHPTTSMAPTPIWLEAARTFEGGFANEEFGTSVAMSDDGSVLAVGSAADSVQTFVYQNGAWSPHGSPIYGLGSTNVVLSGDGQVLAIGDPAFDSGKGRINVLEFSGAQWRTKGTQLTGEGGTALGSVMALSGDGEVLVTGEPRELTDYGRVQLFEFNLDWEVTNFATKSPKSGELVGSSVAISADGYTVVVGSLGVKKGSKLGVGQVDVYRYDFDNGKTEQIGKSITGADAGQGLGKQVALLDDASLIAASSASGIVELYRLESGKKSSSWSSFYKDSSPMDDGTLKSFALGIDTATNQLKLAFSFSSCDADPCVNEIGWMRMLESDVNQNAWTQLGQDLMEESVGDRGLSLAISSDGDMLASGVPGASGTNGPLSGMVRVYRQSGTSR